MLWGWAGGEIAAVSKFVTRGAINTCALSWRAGMAACGLAGGLTCLLATRSDHWSDIPPFVGIPKMAPDEWETSCQVTGAPFTLTRYANRSCLFPPKCRLNLTKEDRGADASTIAVGAADLSATMQACLVHLRTRTSWRRHCGKFARPGG